MIIATINLKKLIKFERDSRWFLWVFYSLFQTWSHINYKSGIQRSTSQPNCWLLHCSTWYPAHIEICKQCNINNTPNTKLHYSIIEIKMLQSGVFWAMSPLGAESPQLWHIVITVAEAEADWKFWFVSNGFPCFLSPFLLQNSESLICCYF